MSQEPVCKRPDLALIAKWLILHAGEPSPVRDRLESCDEQQQHKVLMQGGNSTAIYIPAALAQPPAQAAAPSTAAEDHQNLVGINYPQDSLPASSEAECPRQKAAWQQGVTFGQGTRTNSRRKPQKHIAKPGRGSPTGKAGPASMCQGQKMRKADSLHTQAEKLPARSMKLQQKKAAKPETTAPNASAVSLGAESPAAGRVVAGIEQPAKPAPEPSELMQYQARAAGASVQTSRVGQTSLGTQLPSAAAAAAAGTQQAGKAATMAVNGKPRQAGTVARISTAGKALMIRRKKRKPLTAFSPPKGRLPCMQLTDTSAAAAQEALKVVEDRHMKRKKGNSMTAVKPPTKASQNMHCHTGAAGATAWTMKPGKKSLSAQPPSTSPAANVQQPDEAASKPSKGLRCQAGTAGALVRHAATGKRKAASVLNLSAQLPSAAAGANTQQQDAPAPEINMPLPDASATAAHTACEIAVGSCAKRKKGKSATAITPITATEDLLRQASEAGTSVQHAASRKRKTSGAGKAARHAGSTIKDERSPSGKPHTSGLV